VPRPKTRPMRGRAKRPSQKPKLPARKRAMQGITLGGVAKPTGRARREINKFKLNAVPRRGGTAKRDPAKLRQEIESGLFRGFLHNFNRQTCFGLQSARIDRF
jgi:hypothetical protein